MENESTPRGRVRLDAAGRLTLAPALRRQLGWRPGEELLVQLVEGELRLSTPRQALLQARALVRRYVARPSGLVESLLAARRRELRGE